ncbi:MAG: hypothetical protein J3K34DRAFT_475495 [Monoraphidium minutum]|nr:MAG: hypothetical protein J3K34DRAFT_475495 [Monoraphidium minutum]
MGKKWGSGGVVLLVAFCQLCIGIVLLGLFEGYKVYRIRYFDNLLDEYEAAAAKARAEGKGSPEQWDPNVLRAQAAISNRSPMGIVWWIAIANNIFAICGLAGVINAQRDLVVAFFGWSAIQMVAGAHFLVDMIVDTTVRYGGEPPGLTGYEKATAFFFMLAVILAVAATAMAMRAIDEIKVKQREEYTRLTTLNLGDTLQFEPDRP